MKESILNRKGARKVSDVPGEILDLLNLGTIESVNLTEWLAVDHLKLIKVVLPSMGITSTDILEIEKNIEKLKNKSSMELTKCIGLSLTNIFLHSDYYVHIVHKLRTHPSDSVRGYGCFLIAGNDLLPLSKKLENAMPLIMDSHFGVREVVWMAFRPEIEKYLSQAIELFSEWALHENEHVRRFVSESTRPRGVWCKHIDRLKSEPALGLPMLEPLKSDPSKYVQDSVGNWLNDASKSKPQFVREICDKWLVDSPTKATNYIVKRAMRTIDKS